MDAARLKGLLEGLRGGLIVSTQASPSSPLHDPVVIAALAKAGELAGCVGHRIDGPEHVRAVRAACARPILGIYKVATPGYEVYITPTVAAARAVAEVGADLIAVDGTPRPRPEGTTLAGLIEGIHALGLPVMADVAMLEEGIGAAAAGADVVATTMSGYTPETAHLRDRGPDLQLVRDLVAAVGVPIVAEGRFHQPEQVAAAFEAGAHAVVVGTAITATGWIAERFVRATPRGSAG
jgi:N-acylglucosamine-6-phosphate 2-epimerase